jgi:heme a synthase
MSPDGLTPSYHSALHRYALVTAGCTFLLLLAGALVTSTGSSLAVPDWPLSFGKFFPPMTGGVLFEHGHRMVAGTVSLLMLGLALSTQRVEERAWVKKLAWTAMGAIILQAVLGGVTVLLHLPTEVSVAHAGLAQIFFCLIVSLALVTSKGWIEERPNRVTDRPSTIRFWATLTTALVYLQILVGAVTRHSGSGLAIPDYPLSFGQILPPDWSASIALQFSHTRVGALVVLYFITHTSYRVCTHYSEEKALFWPAAAAALLVWLQCFLGIIVIATAKAIVPTSLHVILGAATLAAMLVLTLNSHHLFKKGQVS